MHRVYSNSMCNIAATGAVDSLEGLFFGRDLGPVDPVQMYSLLEGTAEKRQIFKTSEVEFRGLCNIVKVDFWKDNALDAPLNRRE